MILSFIRNLRNLISLDMYLDHRWASMMVQSLVSRESHDCRSILYTTYYSLYVPRPRRCRVALAIKSRGTSPDLTVIESLREFFRWRSSLSSSSRSASTTYTAVYTCKSVRIQTTCAFTWSLVIGTTFTCGSPERNIGERVWSDSKKIGQSCVNKSAGVFVSTRVWVCVCVTGSGQG